MDYPFLITAQLHGTVKLFLDLCESRLRISGGTVGDMGLTNILNDTVQIIMDRVAKKVAFLYLSQLQRADIKVVLPRRMAADHFLSGGLQHQIHLGNPHISDLVNENLNIQDVLNGLVWDGIPRIRSCLHHFLGADKNNYVEEMLKHFLLGAIRRVFHPGSKYEELLCLVGGQGAGKSTFFRFLAIQDEWFSDDLKKLDDDKVFAKLQGHWIIEMSEMLATSNAKSIEEIRSFISRQKETYRTPYETQPKDRLRQCVFGGSSNTLDFLPLDRAGNRRFLPVMIYPEKAEVHILEDEAVSREYLLQMWAEAMTIYRSGEYSMKFSKEIQKQLVEVQKDFMPEDTEAGQIQGFLEHYTGNVVCSKQLFKEALGHTFEEPKRWQLHNINEIMNTVVTGWKPFSNPRMFAGYGRQRGWEREMSGNELPDNEGGFVELSEEEVRQLELPKEWIA